MILFWADILFLVTDTDPSSWWIILQYEGTLYQVEEWSDHLWQVLDTMHLTQDSCCSRPPAGPHTNMHTQVVTYICHMGQDVQMHTERPSSVVVSMYACHAVSQGSLPRPGALLGVKTRLSTLEIVYLSVRCNFDQS